MAELAPIRILIVEDHFVARAGMAAVLNAQSDMTVVAEVSNGELAVKAFREYVPDVTLIDMRMPGGMSGFEAVAIIKAQFPAARIVALSTFGGDEDIRRTLNAGAKSYLTKDILHGELLDAIRVSSLV